MGATAAMTALKLSSSYAEASSIQSEANYQKSIADINTRFTELNAQDALKRGEKDVLEVKKQAKRIAGSQRVALASQGIDLSSGTAIDLQQNTAEQSSIDAITIRNNAWKEAWGYHVQGMNYSTQGQFAQLSAENKSRNTLLTGGIQAYQLAGAPGFGGKSGGR